VNADRLVNARRAARFLGISRTELYRAKCEGLISAEYVRLRSAMYTQDELERYRAVLDGEREREAQRLADEVDLREEAAGRQRTYHFPEDTIVVIYDEED
jgi:hypothetical protein